VACGDDDRIVTELTADDPSSRTRFRNMRILSGVRVVSVVMMAVTAVACGDGSGTGAAKEVTVDTSADDHGALVIEREDRTERCTNSMDWLVFVEADASSDQIDGVEQALLEVPDVERISYLDRTATYEEAKEIFADQPRAIDALSPNSLPTSFRVWSTSGDEPPATLTNLRGVRDVTVCVPDEGSSQDGADGTQSRCSWIVFLQPGVSEPGIALVRKHLDETDGLDTIVYIDQQAAYEEFRELFADDPNKIDEVSPGVLPASFRVWSQVGTAPPADLANNPDVGKIAFC